MVFFTYTVRTHESGTDFFYRSFRFSYFVKLHRNLSSVYRMDIIFGPPEIDGKKLCTRDVTQSVPGHIVSTATVPCLRRHSLKFFISDGQWWILWRGGVGGYPNRKLVNHTDPVRRKRVHLRRKLFFRLWNISVTFTAKKNVYKPIWSLNIYIYIHVVKGEKNSENRKNTFPKYVFIVFIYQNKCEKYTV